MLPDNQHLALRSAYAGWLITNPEFLSSRDEFRQRWGRVVADLGRFFSVREPQARRQPRGQTRVSSEFREAYVRFCQHWNLEALATWDHPVPMPLISSHPNTHAGEGTGAFGLTLTVPYYLLRAKDISLYQLAGLQRVFGEPAHLTDWVEWKTQNVGFYRYARMLRVYLYVELCLRARYGSRLRGKTGRIEAALADYLLADPDGAESIKKDRQRIAALLKTYQAPQGRNQESSSSAR